MTEIIDLAGVRTLREAQNKFEKMDDELGLGCVVEGVIEVITHAFTDHGVQISNIEMTWHEEEDGSKTFDVDIRAGRAKDLDRIPEPLPPAS